MKFPQNTKNDLDKTDAAWLRFDTCFIFPIRSNLLANYQSAAKFKLPLTCFPQITVCTVVSDLVS